ncbi:MAG: hypothetical protein HQ464_05895 [Planctomycetes bacterium]|nr:hypothetical protein [Planctomycetota bacterium]
MRIAGLGRLLLDGASACLLVLSLAAVYAWESMPDLASVRHSPGLLNPSPPASPVPRPAAKPTNSSQVDVPAKPTASTVPVASTAPATPAIETKEVLVAKAEEPPLSPQPRFMLERPRPQPEAAPVVAQKLLTQTDLNKFGNPEGEGYGLAKTGEFAGAKLLVWSVDSEVIANIFTNDNPLWAALRDKGFDIEMKTTNFQGSWLGNADQLWIFSGNQSGMDKAACAAVASFVGAGKGLYLIADNEPYLVDAATLARLLFDATITGNFDGGNIIAVRGHGVTRDDFRQLGKDSLRDLPRDDPDVSNRIAIINKASHYVEEHPLLTDVNFIFEGVTISHIEPSSRLQTVLTAFDRQVLAAVSADADQRVVVDCGFTRYFYSSQYRFVTETAGTIRYAENIAAYLMGKDSKQHDGTTWAQRRQALEKYRTANRNDVVLAFQNPDPLERWAAVTMSGRRRLDVPAELIGMLRDSEPVIRRAARKALCGLAGGDDFGPSDDATEDGLTLSIQQWTIWLERQKLLASLAGKRPDEIAAAMSSSHPHERWAAVTVALQKRLDLPDEYIEQLADPEPEIRQQARQALVRLAGGDDFGPSNDATEDGLKVSIQKWTHWLERRKLLQSFAGKPPAEVAAAMNSSHPDERWAAVNVALQQGLDLPDEYIERLADPEPEIRQQARQALVRLAGGDDFSPAPDAAIIEWKRWRVVKKIPGLRRASTDELVAGMSATDDEQRWAATIIVHRKKLPLATELIELLMDADLLIQQEARQALVQLAKGEDFGPEMDASTEKAVESAEQWSEWWMRATEKTASQKLRQARVLLDKNPEAARRRLVEIVTRYKGTDAAQEAQRLLGGAPK